MSRDVLAGDAFDPLRGRRRLVLFAATIGLAGSYSPMAVSSFSFFIVPLDEEFGWGRGNISVALTVLSYTVAALSPFVGGLIDKFGGRRVLLPTLIAFGLTFLALAGMSGPFWVFLFLYFMLALSGAGTTPSTYSHLIVRWYDRNRGTALGIALSGVGLSLIITPPIFQYAIEHYGWRSGYLVLGGIILLLILPICVLWLTDRPGQASAAGSDPVKSPAISGPGLAFGEALRHKAFWRMVVSFFLLGVFTAGFSAHLVPMLSDRGMDGAVIAMVVSVKGIAIIIGRLATGWLFDKIPPRLVVFVTLLGPVACLIMLYFGASGFAAFVAVLLAGIGVGAELDFMSYLSSRYFGVKHYAKVYGVLYAALIFGSGTGPLLMGYCYQMTGDYQIALLALTCITALAIVPLMLLGPYTDFEATSAEPLRKGT